MIHVKRTRVEPPQILLDKGLDEIRRAAEYYQGSPSRPFDFYAYRDGSVRNRLLELFYGKCAFCETPLEGPGDASVETFRPKWIAINLDGAITKPAYWWLTNEWSNLYPACRACNSTKAERFPVAGPRGTYQDPDAALNQVSLEGAPITHLASSGDGRYGVSVQADGTITRWTLNTMRPQFIFKTEHALRTIHVSHSGGRVIGLGEPNLLLVWDVRREVREYIQEAHEAEVTALALSPDGSTCLTGSFEGELAFWDLESRALIRRFSVSPERINALSFESPRAGVSPGDGERCYFVDEAGVMSVWNLDDGLEEHRYVDEDVLNGLAVVDDGELIAVHTPGGVVRFIDSSTCEARFRAFDSAFQGDGLSANASGRYLLTTSPSGAAVFDVYSRRVVREFHFDAERGAAAMTPNGGQVLIGAGNLLEVRSLDSIVEEYAVLLDPCLDRPENDLVFDENGQVAALDQKGMGIVTQSGEISRGQVTIDTFGLNRADLVERRRAEYELLQVEVKKLAGTSSWEDSAQLQDALAALIRPDRPFAAMRRQLLPRLVEELDIRIRPPRTEQKLVSEYETLQHGVDKSVVKEAFKGMQDREAERQTGCVEGATDSFEPVQVTRVEIKNFRCIADLTIDIAGGSSDRAGWRVLLGENGVGKSSVLAAIALAVMGQDLRERLTDINQAKLLRRGEDEGCVKVYFSTDLDPVEIQLTEDGIQPAGRANPRTYLLGFGSARWLPRPGSEEPETGGCVRVRNLFNPFVPLTDALDWLEKQKRTLHYTKFRPIEDVLVRLLLQPPETRIRLSDDVLYVVPPGRTIARADRLDELSDGYQTILAIAAAILEMLGPKWSYEMEAADGLVLLDEIGAHLHPRWKLRIVESLRSAFPRMQFIATTHEPLCLRGLEDGEVAVLKKTRENRVYMVTNLPSIKGMRVEQLLTSEHFGLSSTIDPELEEAFERYYELLRIRKPGPQELEELDELRSYLARNRVLGATRRERLMLEAIDRQLAVADTGPEARTEALSNLDDDLANLIDEVEI